jgi:hypothetical protein
MKREVFYICILFNFWIIAVFPEIHWNYCIRLHNSQNIWRNRTPISLCWIDFGNPLNSEKGQLCRVSFPIYSKCKETENCPCNTNKITTADRITANTGRLACYQSGRAKVARCFLKRIGRLLFYSGLIKITSFPFTHPGNSKAAMFSRCQLLVSPTRS